MLGRCQARHLAAISPVLSAPVVDRLVTDVEVMRDAGNTASLGEQIENLAAEFGWIAQSSRLNLLASGTRIQKTQTPWNPGHTSLRTRRDGSPF